MDFSSPWGRAWAGRLHEHAFDSEALTGNPLGDPHVRPLYVYTPPGYDDEPDRRYPSVYAHPGHDRPGRHVAQPQGRSANRRRADRRLVRGRGARRRSSCYVDAWTSYGGSQFLDSPGTGRYHTYLCDELVPFVDARYRTLPRRAHRGDRRQEQRRLRRHGHADAAPGPVRRPGHPRRRRAVRGLLPARVPRRPPARCATSTAARSTPSGRTSAPARAARSAPMRALVNDMVHGRLLLDRCRRHGPPARSTPPPAG